MFKANKTGPVIGIDISPTAIKAVLASRSGKKYVIEQASIVSIDVSKNTPDAPKEGVVQALKKLAKEFSLKESVLAVAAQEQFHKIIQLPAGLSIFDLEDQVKVDLGKEGLPFNTEDAALDFQVLGPSAQPNFDRVLIAAVRQELIDERVQFVGEAGLNLASVTSEPFALGNLLYQIVLPGEDGVMDPKGTYAVFDLGDNAVKLYVFQDHQLIFHREQSGGGRILLEETMREFGFSSIQEAASARVRGELPAGYEEQVLEPFRLTMTQQINRLMQLYLAQSSGSSSQPNALFLTGGVAMVPGFDDYVSQMTGYTTRRMDLLSHVTLGKKADEKLISRADTAIQLAFALSLRGLQETPTFGVNLLPWRADLRKNTQRQFGIMMGAAAALGAAVVAGLMMYNGALVSEQQSRNRFLTTKIAEVDEKILEVESLDQKKAQLLARAKVIETLQANRYQMVELLQNLAHFTPDSIRVLEVRQEGGLIEVDGRAESNSSVSHLMNNIDTSPFMNDPEVVVIKLDEKTATVNTADDPEIQLWQTALKRYPYAFTLRFKTPTPEDENAEEGDSSPEAGSDAPADPGATGVTTQELASGEPLPAQVEQREAAAEADAMAQKGAEAMANLAGGVPEKQEAESKPESVETKADQGE